MNFPKLIFGETCALLRFIGQVIFIDSETMLITFVTKLRSSYKYLTYTIEYWAEVVPHIEIFSPNINIILFDKRKPPKKRYFYTGEKSSISESPRFIGVLYAVFSKYVGG